MLISWKRPICNFQQPTSYISLQQNYRLFYKHACNRAIDKAAQVIDCILWWSRVRGLRARRQMFFSAAASQKWGARLGRTTQRDELFMASLHDTTASQGRDGWCSGRKDEQTKSKWRRVEGLEGEFEEEKRGWAEHLSQWTASLLTSLHTLTSALHLHLIFVHHGRFTYNQRSSEED